MAVLDHKKTLRNMLKKGFEESLRDSDHVRIEFWYEGKLTRCRTKFSHNRQDLDDWLIQQMSKQVQLSKSQFIQFAQCTLTEKQYISILKDLNII